MKHWRNFDFQLVGIPAGLVAFSVFVLLAISRWPTSGVTIGTPIHQAAYALTKWIPGSPLTRRPGVTASIQVTQQKGEPP